MLPESITDLFVSANRGLDAVEIAVEAGYVTRETSPRERVEATVQLEGALAKAAKGGEIAMTTVELADRSSLKVFWANDRAPKH